ncbi:MAG TPA: ATPase, partial [Micromonosporaceae bacterium]
MISRALILLGRLAVLIIVTVLGWLATGSPWIFLFTGLLFVAALPALFVPQPPVLAPIGRAAEVIITCVGADFAIRYAHPGMFAPAGAAAGAMLPYLMVPPVAAALRRRRLEMAWLLALSAVGLVVVGLIDNRISDRGYVTEAIEWLLLAAI